MESTPFLVYVYNLICGAKMASNLAKAPYKKISVYQINKKL